VAALTRQEQTSEASQRANFVSVGYLESGLYKDFYKNYPAFNTKYKTASQTKYPTFNTRYKTASQTKPSLVGMEENSHHVVDTADTDRAARVTDP